MKKTLLALAILAISGSAMACGSRCSMTTSGSQSASVKGSSNSQIGTGAYVSGNGSSTSTATGFSAAGAVAGGIQGSGSAGTSLPYVGHISGTANGAVIGGGQFSAVGGSASNTSTGAGEGYAFSVGESSAKAKASADGSIERNARGHANDGHASYSIKGETESTSFGGVGVATNEYGSFSALNAGGFLGAGGVALSNCESNVNFVAGGVVDIKGSYSTANATFNGEAAEGTGAEAGGTSGASFEGSFKGTSKKNGLTKSVPSYNPNPS